MYKRKCKYCGKQFDTYVKNKKFHINTCYFKWRVGKNHPLYKKSFEDIYGVRRGKIRKKQLSDINSKRLKGVTYEKRYGSKERADKIKAEIRKSVIKNHHFNNKTWLQVLGKERAERERKKIRKRQLGKTFQERYGKKRSEDIQSRMSNSLRNNPYFKKTFDERFGEVKSKKVRENISISLRKNPDLVRVYDFNFSERLKKQVIKRDKDMCQLCGEKVNKGHCHHIHYNKKDSRLETLVLLHIKCHRKTHYNIDYWFAYFCYKKGVECESIV